MQEICLQIQVWSFLQDDNDAVRIANEIGKLKILIKGYVQEAAMAQLDVHLPPTNMARG